MVAFEGLEVETPEGEQQKDAKDGDKEQNCDSKIFQFFNRAQIRRLKDNFQDNGFLAVFQKSTRSTPFICQAFHRPQRD